ncbi:MAG: hypothetical protein IKM34_07440 [Clostridia bacterium]|nr:hypothetical protein [Clostridia bacterium]
MENLIKTNVLTYAVLTAFTGFLLLSIIYGIFKKTKRIENKKKKTVLRFGISGVLVCFWIWFFIYVNLFPISLAYYEYSHDCVEERIGTIESIEQDGKDRINIIIDNTEYTMVHSSVNPAVAIGKDIDEGDTVKFIFGVESKYIFDIYESNTNP